MQLSNADAANVRVANVRVYMLKVLCGARVCHM